MGPNQLKCNQVGCSSIPVGYNFSHMWCVGNLSRVYKDNRQIMGPNQLKCNQLSFMLQFYPSRVYKDSRQGMGPHPLKCNQVGCSSIPVGYNISHMWCVHILSRFYKDNRQIMGPNQLECNQLSFMLQFYPSRVYKDSRQVMGPHPLKCKQVDCSSIPVGYNFSHMWCVRILSRVYKDGRLVMGPNQLSAIKWVWSCSSIPKNLYEKNEILNTSLCPV